MSVRCSSQENIPPSPSNLHFSHPARNLEIFMTYAIIAAGNIGSAETRQFASKSINASSAVATARRHSSICARALAEKTV
jgi:hypothetical protein